MKKLFILIIILNLSTSCAVKMRTFLVYDRQYFNPSEALIDIYTQTANHGVDSIPLENWITLRAKSPDSDVIQKTIIYNADEKTSYRFIYTIYTDRNIAGSTYVFKILCDTKEKIGKTPVKCVTRNLMK